MNDGQRIRHKNFQRLAKKSGGVCGLAMLTLVAVACARPTPQVSDTGAAPLPLAVELPRAILPDGATVDLELATTPEETTTGLMFRPSLPTDRGMLLLWSEERYATIWMMNVLSHVLPSRAPGSPPASLRGPSSSWRQEAPLHMASPSARKWHSNAFRATPFRIRNFEFRISNFPLNYPDRLGVVGGIPNS